MSAHQRRVVLLGPQPEYATLKVAISEMGLRGTVALITAGWETEEGDDLALKQAVGIESVNLNLFARTEKLFADDPELIETLRRRQDDFRLLRDAYKDRLNSLLKAARQMLRREDSVVKFDEERESAIGMVRQLDHEYFVRTSEVHRWYEGILDTPQRHFVREHRERLREVLDNASAILISGGHVAIILNRLRIFGVLDVRPDLPVIAWSGGAMALAKKIVFFHDSPPQGAGNAELLRAGMNEFDDLLPLPHARSRLKLQDQTRVALFARRFNHQRCVVFDERTILDRVNGNWRTRGSTTADQLSDSGNLVEVKS